MGGDKGRKVRGSHYPDSLPFSIYNSLPLTQPDSTNHDWH